MNFFRNSFQAPKQSKDLKEIETILNTEALG